MRSSKAPAGYVTQVEAIVCLRDGQTFIERWTTPMGLSQAYSKAPGWAKAELKRKKIRGRSTIVGLNVEVRYSKGSYKR